MSASFVHPRSVRAALAEALHTVGAFLRRDFLITTSYRAAFLMDLSWIVLVVPILFLISRMFEGSSAELLRPYDGNYFAFLLIGVAFQDYVTFSQTNFNTAVREHQLMGTLEIVMMSPMPVPVVLLCSSAWGYLYTSVRFIAWVLVGLAFGFSLARANVPAALLVMVLAIASFSALGILTAAVVVLIKRGAESITQIMSAATIALSGVLYPVEMLPAWLARAAELLPFTHALRGLRLAILRGAGVVELRSELLALTLFALVLFPIGLAAFALAVRRSKLTGTLGQY